MTTLVRSRVVVPPSQRAVVAAVFLLQLALFGKLAGAASASPSTTSGGAKGTNNKPACSRERSRHARAVLDEFFFPVVLDKNRFALPPNCPFDRAKDMYLEHERHKEVVRRTQWKSTYSDKVFRSEYYVDKHMDNRHMDKIPPGADVCLADYCDVLQCDEHQGYRHPDTRRKTGGGGVHHHNHHGGGGGGRGRHGGGDGRCNEEKLKGVRHFCEVLMNRCFPHGSAGGGGGDGGGGGGGEEETGQLVAATLHDYFVRHHCDLLTCEGAPRMFHLLRSHHAEFHRGAYLTMLIVLLFLLALYYLSIYCWTKDMRHGPGPRDLRRARKEKTASLEKVVSALLVKLVGTTTKTKTKKKTTWWHRPLDLVLFRGKRRKHKAY